MQRKSTWSHAGGDAVAPPALAFLVRDGRTRTAVSPAHSAARRLNGRPINGAELEGSMVLNGALFLLACAAALAAASAGDGPLLNGNFEYPPDRSQMNGTRVTGNHAIPYWKVTGFVEYIEAGAKQDHMVLPVPEGKHAVRLGTESSVQQQLSVTRGKYYSITFSAARTCAQSEKLNVSIVPGGASGELPIQTVYTSSGWDSYAWAFKAKQGVVSLIIHHGDDQMDDPACGPIVDAVAIRTLNPPKPTPQNMLINGDFEEGPYMTPGSPWGVLVPPMNEDATSPLPGWMIMSHSKVVKYIDAAHFRVPHGSCAVELVAGVEVSLVQEVATVAGRKYRLQFSVGDAGNKCATSAWRRPCACRWPRRTGARACRTTRTAPAGTSATRSTSRRTATAPGWCFTARATT